MSQDNQDNQNPDQQNQGQEQPEGWEKDQQVSDDITREGRAAEPESEPLQGGVSSPDLTPAADDLDDMDDEDRDEDSREDGSPNRRNNIG